MPTAYDHITRNLDRYRRLAPRFARIFGRQLRPYWNNLTGFDVIKFDDLVKPGKKESTKDAVLRRYGQEGVDLVYRLIDRPKE